MPSIVESVKSYLQSLIPTKKVTIYRDKYAPQVSVETMDVDRAQSIIESAIDGDTRDLFALYRDLVLTDPHLQNEFGKRKLAVLGDKLSIAPIDKKLPEDVAAAEACRGLSECPSWVNGCIRLLDSTLMPVAVLEKVYRPSTQPGLRFELAELVTVPDQLLDYTEAGAPGEALAHGELRIRDTDPVTGQVLATTHEVDPHRYIVHRGHLLTTADNRGGPMRSLVFWCLFSQMTPNWWARFLEKYGSPFLVGKYDQADDQSRAVLERAFQWAVRIGGLVVSKQTEVEVMQAATAANGEGYKMFLDVCQREKSKLILGQTLSSESQPTGIGGGASGIQEGVRQDIRQWDAARLGSTLKLQLFAQYLEINGLTGRPPNALWGGESAEDAAATGKLLADLKQAGLELTDEGIANLSERTGLLLQRVAAPAGLGLPGDESGTGRLPKALSMGARSLRLFSGEAQGVTDADAANDEVARAGSAELVRAFRGSLAPVRRMIEESESAEDLQARMLAAYADWSVQRVAVLIEQALVAFTANRMAASEDR